MVSVRYLLRDCVSTLIIYCLSLEELWPKLVLSVKQSFPLSLDKNDTPALVVSIVYYLFGGVGGGRLYTFIIIREWLWGMVEPWPGLKLGLCSFYVPASYILYLSDFCRFLLCTCGWERRGRGGAGEGEEARERGIECIL